MNSGRRRQVLAVALLLTVAAGPAPAAEPADVCNVPAALLDLGAELPRSAQATRDTRAFTIVAVGSSSTAGAGATRPTNAYPPRLGIELGRALPGAQVRVINRGINGELAGQMVARFARDVGPANPDLVVWQVGSNAVLRESGVARYRQIIANGVRWLRARKIDVILMDLQYAPEILADPDHGEMERILADVARREKAGLFRRFEIMRHWRAGGRTAADAMLSSDGLHLSDLGYRCLGRTLAQAILQAIGRPAADPGL